MPVTFDDCRRDLLIRANRRGQQEYHSWHSRPGYAEVVAFVENFAHSYLFTLSAEEVEEVIRRTEHALGKVRKEEQLPEVENFTCPFAYQHLFHRYVEEHQRIPTWGEYFAWLRGPAAPLFLQPLQHALHWEKADPERRQKLKQAMRWRLGNFYYSALRELDLITRLRTAHGLPLKYHLLADVLLRVDFWLEDVLICTYVPNDLYRNGSKGRKPSAVRFFEGTALSVREVPITRQGFGKLWRVSEESIDDILRAIDDRQQTEEHWLEDEGSLPYAPTYGEWLQEMADLAGLDPGTNPDSLADMFGCGGD